MEEVKDLTRFYDAIKEDNRIGATHIALYMAIFQLHNSNNFSNPVHIRRASVMELSKIRGLATYHKCIKDLNDFGYIHYVPSYDPLISSIVWLQRDLVK